MKTLEDLSRTAAALMPFQKSKDVARFLRNCINSGKADSSKHGQFQEAFTLSVKQCDRKWSWTTWRVCAESEIEHALVEKAWQFLTSKDSLLAHIIFDVSTWNELQRNRAQGKGHPISVDNVLALIKLIKTTDIYESCSSVLQMEKVTAQKGFVCSPLEQVMFACLLINNMTNASREDKELKISQYIKTAELGYSDKFSMAAICKSLLVLEWLWDHDDSNELDGLCDDLVLYLIPKLSSEDMELTRWLCDKVKDVVHKNKDGDTLLHIAVKVRDRQIVEDLLNKGANVQAVNHDGKTPLHKVAEVGYADVVQLLLDKGAEIETINSAWSTALHKAAESDQTKAIEVLLKRGARIESKNGDGDTPLQVAIKRGKIKAVDVLLKSGADIEVQNNAGNTPLLIAIEYCQIKAAEMLLGRGAIVDAENKKGCKLEQISIKSCRQNPDLILSLLNWKLCDVITENDSGDTFLHAAARSGYISVIEQLIARGALVNKQNTAGETALHIACRNGHAEVAKSLINADVDVALTNAKRRTALHEAAWNSHLEIVELLLSGLSEQYINAQDHKGKTALHLAAEFNVNKNIVCALLKKGADVQLKCNEMKPAWHLAACNQHTPEIFAEFCKRM